MSRVASDSQTAMPFAQQVASRESTASSQMRQVELSEVVREALNVLGEDQRMAVLLNKFEDMSYAEIGEVMSRSPAAIKSLLARARNELRSALDPTWLQVSAVPTDRPRRALQTTGGLRPKMSLMHLPSSSVRRLLAQGLASCATLWMILYFLGAACFAAWRKLHFVVPSARPAGPGYSIQRRAL